MTRRVLVSDKLRSFQSGNPTLDRYVNEYFRDFASQNFEDHRFLIREQGHWISPEFAAGDYTANGSMTWTVASGDVSTFEYTIIGETMIVNFAIVTSTVGGTPNTTLRIAIPGGRTSAKLAYAALGVLLDNLVRATGTISVGVGGTVINIERTDLANFTASTNQTYVAGSIAFELEPLA